jgi:sugar/nucleoside kinase (ribokinase family)
MLDVITIGSALEDIIFQTTEGEIIDTPENPLAQAHLGFEFGAKINIDKAEFGIGGGACNAAVALALLGLQTGASVRVGTDKPGKRIREHLIELGINVDLMQYDSVMHTGLSALIVKMPEGEHVIFPYRGANNHLEFHRDDVTKLKPAWIYASSLSGSNWQETMNGIRAYIKETGAKFAFNPGSAQFAMPKNELKEVISHTEILLINRDEAIEIVSGYKEIKGDVATSELLQEIHKLGATIAIITEGEKGASATDGTTLFQSDAFPVETLDTTGAGDSFGSTFTGGMIKTNDVRMALSYAICNSAYVTSKVGAQNGLLSLTDIQEVSKQVKVTTRPLVSSS